MAVSTDPFATGSDPSGGGYVPPAPTPPPISSGNPFDVGNGYNPATDPNAGFVLPPVSSPYQQQPLALSAGGGGSGNQGGGGNFGGGGGGGQIPWGQIFDTSLGNRSLDQQQQYLDYMLKTYYPWAEKLQSDITQAQMTGDYQGVQTLQAQLQNMNLNMQNLMNGANLSGMYNGSPTMQFQQVQNQYAQSQDLQRLQARSQDEQMAAIQAQIAQSPLVGWYTARGLPPPQSALIGSLGQFNPSQMNWTQNNSPPAIGQLPVNGLTGPTFTPPSTPQITNTAPAGGGYQTRGY